MGWETIFYFYQKWVDRNFSIIAKFWHSKNFNGIAKISQCRSEIHCSPMLDPLFHWPLFPTSYSLLFFLLFSSCFEILHSRLAEIDIRPYEIDGNQPDLNRGKIEEISEIFPSTPYSLRLGFK